MGQEWARRVLATLRVPRRLARSVWDGVHELAWAAEVTSAGLMVPADVLDRLGPAAGRLLRQAGVLAGWSGFWWRLRDPTPIPAAGWWDAAEAWLTTTAGARALDHAWTPSGPIQTGIRILHASTGDGSRITGPQAIRVLQRAGVDSWVLEGVLGQAGVLHYQNHGAWRLTPPRHMLTVHAVVRRVAA